MFLSGQIHPLLDGPNNTVMYNHIHPDTHTHTHNHAYTDPVEMEPIRGGLRGRPVLCIDPDTGPLVSKRLTAGDLLCYL